MKLEHVIGKDGLHRLRLTAANGEITDNSHEGLEQRHSALRNLRLKLTSYLHLGGFPGNAAEHLANSPVDVMLNNDIPTVDERPTSFPDSFTPGPGTRTDAELDRIADGIVQRMTGGHYERVPQDPLEPQTLGPVEPQLR